MTGVDIGEIYTLRDTYHYGRIYTMRIHRRCG